MFEDRESRERSPAHATALDCLEAGIQAAHPGSVTKSCVSLTGSRLQVGPSAVDDAVETIDLAGYDEIVVVGGGKASVAVAAQLEEILGPRLTGGVVVTDRDKRGDADSTERPSGSEQREETDLDRVEVRYGSHPVPDEAGVAGARELLDLVTAADENTLVVGLITGGGSALLPAPAEGISLSDLQETTDALLAAGATIHEINAVRKHLSALKGGRLAEAATPARVVGLVVSDVVGNDLDVIASGPFVPDPTTYADAADVLNRYDLEVPESVRRRLDRGEAGELAETPKPGDRVFDRVTTHVLADGYTAVDAARNRAEDGGYDAMVLSSRVRGESREAAKTFVAIGEEIAATGEPVSPPAVVVSGGETTVTIRGGGRGGPNQEFALAAAGELAGGDANSIVVAAADTDGFDGPTDAAGGIVDGNAVPRTEAADALADNDAYTALNDRELLLKSGKTGTNVNDLRVLVVEE
ncbi:DUF4147 domain-containing protein [Halalkaliarchaeum sp. AArc-CO]|uniref:glycerate kinase type-2 family protein n=1 Tax=Halalkaliarchaeum sp. AArc-CO TaxID=2866381 RepID=UPI00217E596E|nr:DUF4147 domain-containing protein [Halalkaliarchaeum sp. AArc-CO]